MSNSSNPKFIGQTRRESIELSIQDQLKDLRVERGLTLEQPLEQAHFSKSALGGYEAEEFTLYPFLRLTIRTALRRLLLQRLRIRIYLICTRRAALLKHAGTICSRMFLSYTLIFLRYYWSIGAKQPDSFMLRTSFHTSVQNL